MKRLIECVPNFSEGRDPAKVDALVDAMSGVPGAWVLDRTSDADHHRSVITLAGEPEAVAEAAIHGVGAAASLIDLTRHSGAHPRIGATDVLPFIPLEGVSIEECVALARRVGHQIWERYRIPVYFYEAAAARPERVNLENVRKGQFEGLLEDALRDPDRSPDIGEPRLHASAGAVAVGVRKILIAYNIHLNTSDVSVAKQIARAIRFSSGGLRHVKAIGLGLKTRGVAQVSINLTDFEQTPLHRVFEMVKREAERHGCAVIGSEIIGLIPRKAIEVSAEYYLQLENFSPARVLENRLAAAVETVRSGASVKQEPGAPIQRVLALLMEATRRLAEEISTQTQPGQSSVLFIEKRAEAFLEMAQAAAQVFEKAVQLETMSATSMPTDLNIARQMALAAANAALENVEVSLAAIDDLEFVGNLKSRAATIQARLKRGSQQVQSQPQPTGSRCAANRRLAGEDR
jgi:glutamate formiminotransferase